MQCTDETSDLVSPIQDSTTPTKKEGSERGSLVAADADGERFGCQCVSCSRSRSCSSPSVGTFHNELKHTTNTSVVRLRFPSRTLQTCRSTLFFSTFHYIYYNDHNSLLLPLLPPPPPKTPRQILRPLPPPRTPRTTRPGQTSHLRPHALDPPAQDER